MSKRARNVVEPPIFELQRGVLPVVGPVTLSDPEAGTRNVKQRSNEVLPCGGSSIRYNRYGKIDVTRLTEAELEELLASESDGGSDCNDGIEDIDWVPNGAASDEELEDVLELHESDDDDENGENVHADMIDPVAEEPDWNATINLLGPDMTYTSKDGTTWAKNPIPITRTRLHNIIRENGGPTNRNMQARCDTMRLIFNDVMKNIILRHTNKKGLAMAETWSAKNPNKPVRKWIEVDVVEFDAFLALLITAGVYKSHDQILEELWAPQAAPIYRASMSRDRFKAILRTIRFDDANTRAKRQATDKGAPISELWMLLNASLKANYKPHDCITIDEQLFPFRGRCPFKQYIPSKPAKYGIKVWWAADAATHYPLRGDIYYGRQPGQPMATNIGANVVQELVKPYWGSGRNITMDNFFTGLDLTQQLVDKKLSVVGTMRKNKRCIPQEMHWTRDRKVGESVFAFRQDVTLVAYCPKPKKNVYVLSSMHSTNAIDAETGKPEIIMEYNRTKAGVDTMDQMLGNYTCKRKSRRWPLAMFFNMVDLSGLAAYVLYSETHGTSNSRRSFLIALANDMATPNIRRRAQISHVNRWPHIRNAMLDMLDIRSLPSDQPQPQLQANKGTSGIKGKCVFCAMEKRQRVTRKCCSLCGKKICDTHCVTITKCPDCQ